MQYLEETNFIIKILKRAFANNLKRRIPKNVEQKSEFDLVTDVDKKIENFIITKIHKKYPLDTFISEEKNPNNHLKGRTWIIDPIDGTCNMARNMKLFGIQCALCVEKKPVLSVIYLPFLSETYYAILGNGSYLNGKKIFSFSDTSLNNCIVSFGDYTHNRLEIAKAQHESIGILYKRIAKIRMFGAACLDFSFLSAGKTDACVVLTKNLWDIIPGILLVQESGCFVYDFEGKDFEIGSYGVIATKNAILKDEILESLK